MKIFLFLAAATVLALWVFWPFREKQHAPGVWTTGEPEQSDGNELPVFEKNGYKIIALATFRGQARALSVKWYRNDREAQLSPVDLVLGWGPMSDQAVLDHIRIRQSGRWYHWFTKEFPIPRREIEIHSANMHMIPADNDVVQSLKSVRKGDLVVFSGYLVSAHGQDNWSWKSSLTRTDTGPGACELVWVEEFFIP